jgi:hypothetical protein
MPATIEQFIPGPKAGALPPFAITLWSGQRPRSRNAAVDINSI